MVDRSTLRRLPALTLALALVTAAACSQAPQSPVSPSSLTTGVLSNTAGGASLKVAAPIPFSPSGNQVLENRKPTFQFQNASGLFTVVAEGEYLIELYRGDTAVYSARVAPDPSGNTSHVYPADLGWETAYAWRVRLELGDAPGPWSDGAQFSTPSEPKAPANPLGFAVPASCGWVAEPMSNRIACAYQVSLLSSEYAGCRNGSGVRCHRFTRHLAAALATGDSRWGLITKNPGEQQCTWNTCGGSVHGGLGEDVVAFRYGPSDDNWQGYDVVVGAGAPGANVGWTGLSGRRPGNRWTPVPPFP